MAVKKVARKSIARKQVAGAKVPVLVKVLSVLAYIGSAFTLIMGLFFMLGSAFIREAIIKSVSAQGAPELAGLGLGAFIFIGIVFIILAVVDFFIARGLWKAQNWAEIVVIVLLVLAGLNSLTNLLRGKVSSIIALAIEGLLVWYLWCNKDVKKAFE